MKIVKIIGAIIITLALFAIISGQFDIYKAVTKNDLGSLYQSGPTYLTSTMATSSVGIYTSATVLSPKARGYAFIQNNSSNNVYLCLAATCAANTGILLQASSTYAITPDNQYIGAVSAIAITATSTLLTTELRQ
jgi:hypothetical protein